MDFKAITASKWFTPALGAALAVLGGLALRSMPPGEAWVNASYDYLFRFAARPVTNQLVLVMMDDAAYAHFGLARGNRWAKQVTTRSTVGASCDAAIAVGTRDRTET